MQYYDKDILSQYPLLLNYFNNGISDENKNLGHLIVLWGSDIKAQGAIANEIARLLNCSQNKTLDCECVNCNGIRENQHEAFKIYTRLDFKDTSKAEDSSKGKKNISIEQVKNIIQDIALTSIYHRVYVFCDRDADGNLLPLNNINFPDTTANALLKTFEEPTQNATFIILTNHPSDIISTIVSRAQTFFVPGFGNQELKYDIVENTVSEYWLLQKDGVFSFADNLFNLTTNNDTSLVLQQFQNYIYSIMMQNFDNKLLFYKLLKDIKTIEDSISQITLGMKPRNVIDSLCYKIFLNY